MTLEDNAPIETRAAQTAEIPFALVSVGQDIPKLKPGLIKTYASIVGHSFLIDGERSTRATNREIADHTYGNPKTIGTHVQELESAGLVKIDQAGRVRTLTITDPQPGQWVKIRMDHPVWKAPDRAFKVFFGLKRFRGQNRVAFMTNQTLGMFLGMKERNVKHGVESLKCMGLIVAKYEWHGFKRYRRVFFPTVNQIVMGEKVPIEDVSQIVMGEKVPIEDVSQQASMGEKVPIEDVSQQAVKTGQKSALGMGEKVPHYGRKSALGMGEKVPIEEEVLRRDLTEAAAKTTHTAHASPQGAEPPTTAGVCELDGLPGQETQAALESMLDQLQGLIKQQIPLKIEQIRIVQEIRNLWAKYGAIPAEFLAESLQSGINEQTTHRTAIITRNLSKWGVYNKDQRAVFGDVITQHEVNQQPQKSTKPSPGENGSGTSVEVVLAKRDGYVACTAEQCDKLNSYPENLRQELLDKKAVRVINGVAWINMQATMEIIQWYEAGYPLGESEILPVVKTKEQELKELAFDRKNVRSKARKKWEKYRSYHQQRIERMPISQEDKAVERYNLQMLKDAKMEEFTRKLLERYDREEQAIESKYAPAEPNGIDHKRA